MTDQELLNQIDSAVEAYRGQLPELEKAIGAAIAGRLVGWKVMLLIHDKRTIQKYEDALDLSFREFMPEEGPLAQKSLAWRVVQKAGTFWKAVKGEVPGGRSAKVS